MEKIIVLGCKLANEDQENFDDSLDEMIGLARTAGAEVIETIFQNRSSIDSAYYLGKGKLEEIKQYLEQYPEISTLAFDGELNPRQVRNLTTFFDKKIIDRTEIILSIFAQRAQTKEAQLEVELAQMKYLLPRLTRMWSHLHRQAGGIGTRGPGESQLETDKRIVRDKISFLNKRLKKVKEHRDRMRQKRMNKREIVIALVGYTNAGKSTLLQSLSHQEVYIADQLFATLDPVIRKVFVPELQKTVLFTDTVGFIRKLPHTLVESFKATLEEILYADIILHVIDTSSDHIYQDIEAVEQVLEEINADLGKVIEVYNKTDLLTKEQVTEFEHEITISALESQTESLMPAIVKKLKNN